MHQKAQAPKGCPEKVEMETGILPPWHFFALVFSCPVMLNPRGGIVPSTILRPLLMVLFHLICTSSISMKRICFNVKKKDMKTHKVLTSNIFYLPNSKFLWLPFIRKALRVLSQQDWITQTVWGPTMTKIPGFVVFVFSHKPFHSVITCKTIISQTHVWTKAENLSHFLYWRNQNNIL